MLNTCPNCGNPVCSDCGTHVSPGAVGAPTFQRAAQFDPVQKPGLVKSIVGWKSSMAPTWNGTYEAYWLQRIDAAVRAISQLQSSPGWASIYPKALAKLSHPNYWSELSAWLTVKWLTPPAFVAFYMSKMGDLIQPATMYSIPGMSYVNDMDRYVAGWAALDFINA